jgi:small subunit ribosomal protein S9
MEMINTSGRRKSSVARIYMTKGDGDITVNGKPYLEYFPQIHVQLEVARPFKVVEIENGFSIKANIKGGGFKGQAEALRLAISKALVELNEDYRRPLKVEKLLTRDAREVERKKYGKPKARKSFQFSKR